MEPRALVQQSFGDVNRWRFSSVPGVFLEREAKDRNLLVRHGVEERLDHFRGEPGLLVLVHVYHLLPVRRYFREVQTLADINEVQDVLLKTGPAKADRGLEELGPDSGIPTHRTCYFGYICSSSLADSRQRVYAGDSLRKKRVGSLGIVG